MKSFVITIMDNPRSVEAADRCIESGEKFGISVVKHPAFTPKDDPEKMMQDLGLNYDRFKNNRYSRFENCMAAFLSHRECWKNAKDNSILVLEHDAVFMNDVPRIDDHLVSIGKPSYGSYKVPKYGGIYPTFSKPGGYLPGAHAYIVSPKAAADMIYKSKEYAEPTDLFLNNKTFPYLKEYYPWCVVADDSFSTIQKEEGCIAKHNYHKGIDII